MFFIGIDLAWSEKNATGIAILRGNRKRATYFCAGIVHSGKEIVDYIKEKVGNQSAFIAIDAPLTVPNSKGIRKAEKLVGPLFRKYGANAYPVNRQLLKKLCGEIRGEKLGGLLKKAGFKHSPYIKKYEAARKFFEVFTHSAMIVLFKLKRILKYKVKPDRNYEFRWKEFRKYQNCLEKLRHAKPSLSLPKEIVKKPVKGLKGLALKQYEDLLDAIFCAYIACYCWANPEQCAVLGSMKRGYILTPVFDFMQKSLSSLSF